MTVIDDDQRIGIVLTGLGILFSMLGIVLFFDRVLLGMGNLLFLAGVTMVIRVRNVARFFFQPKKVRGSVCFLGGILMVLFGWTIIGILVEAFGFINLFGNFFPFVLHFLRSMPVVGSILNLPGIKQLVDTIVLGGRLPV
eukprot:TRINITY_DN2507_c0_g1_i1.p1 TRINITY_DN2507_c0_g1~~TRINITY_DN2507_c0_g1_i1.p1  ORF type:complete len:140 (-),score=16.54 TRINITY_DN2507_c0_g1_i1:133-552(-)